MDADEIGIEVALRLTGLVNEYQRLMIAAEQVGALHKNHRSQASCKTQPGLAQNKKLSRVAAALVKIA